MKLIYKISNGIFYILMESMESSEYFTLKAHLNSDYPRFKCSIVTCGWWPSNWTAQVSKVTMRMYVRHTYFG